MLLSADAFAQTDRVTLSNPDLSLRQALKETGAQAGLKLAVNQSGLDLGQPVGTTYNDLPVDNVLQELLNGTGHSYVIRNGYIMVFPMSEVDRYVAAAQPAPTPAPTPSKPVEAEVMALDPATTYIEPQSDKTLPAIEVNTLSMPIFPSIRQNGPKFALKTNLLVGAVTYTPNLAAEIGLGRKTTLDLSVGYNPWNLDGEKNNNKKMVHLIVEPEFRYWFCERFNGHFLGVHALGAHYNVSGYDFYNVFDKEYRYEGYALGGGISYGYHWMWSKHWSLELTAGIGAAWLTYDKYDCPKCGDKIGSDTDIYFGPTKAGINLVYIIK